MEAEKPPERASPKAKAKTKAKRYQAGPLLFISWYRFHQALVRLWYMLGSRARICNSPFWELLLEGGLTQSRFVKEAKLFPVLSFMLLRVF